jgi:anti-sigma regulatory factor (Ser/Thr protein kinase)
LELVIENRLEEIARVHEQLDELAAREGLPARPAADIHIALEEYLTNSINYGYPGNHPGRIAVRFHLYPSELRVEIEDDARPFNPLLAPAVDIHQPIDERPVGGLGLHLIRKLTDQLRYERQGDCNKVVLVKRLEGWQGPRPPAM